MTLFFIISIWIMSCLLGISFAYYNNYINNNKCIHDELTHSLVHVYEREYVIIIYCDKCHKELYAVSLKKIYEEKSCYCCYCNYEKKGKNEYKK